MASSQEEYKYSISRQWRILLVYNIYRILSIFVFLGIFLYSPPRFILPSIYYLIIGIYFFCGVLFLFIWYYKIIRFETQIFISGTVDVLAIASLLSILGVLQTGFGILLNVTIAALSILAPGRIAIYFAALASCLLLGGSTVQYLFEGQKDLTIFFYSGIYGTGFFATAITAWYLAKWVKVSEMLAEHHSQELAGLQRINEYIVERLHSGVIYVNMEGQIKLINTAARDFFNIPPDIELHNLKQLSAELKKKFLSFLKKSARKERTVQTLLNNPFLKVNFFQTTLGNFPAVLIILDDMIGIAQQAQQLKLASLGRFSASIAHELRNPLGAISHAVQLMGDEEDLSKEDLRLKQMIINNCNRMNRVIKNVLQLSRREQAKPEAIDLASFLKQFKHDYCQTNNCQLDINLPASDKTRIIFDKSQLEQILVILCDNAMQHGQDDSGKAHISIDVQSSAREIVMAICDKGKGIPEKIRDDIFEPFYTTVRSGTGMGLFIARDLCEINQARLGLLNAEQGSCFAIIVTTSNEQLI